MSILKKHWPLFASLFLFGMLSAFCLAYSLRRNEGHFVYALDDAYIHMAMAKHFSEEGVWGITRYSFSSSSSAPLWTLLLSFLYTLFGASPLTPFLLNLFFAALLCTVSYRMLKKYEVKEGFNFLILVGVIFFTPLIALVFSGQEHVLHILLTVLLLGASTRMLSWDRPDWRQQTGLLCLAFLLTAIRYEGFFLVFTAAVLFVWKKRTPFAGLLAGAGLLPIVLLGWFSFSHGWHFLPNPVWLKGNLPDLSSLSGMEHFLGNFLIQLKDSHTVLMLLMGALALFIYRCEKTAGIWRETTLMLFLFLVALLMHLTFARLGHFFRYEAYLVASGFLVIGIALAGSFSHSFKFETLHSSWPKYGAGGLLLLLWLAPFLQRGAVALHQTPRAAVNIFQQQYQIGMFLKEFYEGQTVAVNDIGVINYLADIRCLDLWGLADLEAGDLRKSGRLNAGTIEQLARAKGAQIAILYDHWFNANGKSLPPSWQKAGLWRIRNNVVCGGDSVSFYAADPAALKDLVRNLKSFAPRLPKEVQQGGLYSSTNH